MRIRTERLRIFLSGQIVAGLSDFRFLEYTPDLVNNKFLSEEEVNAALSSNNEIKSVYREHLRRKRTAQRSKALSGRGYKRQYR